MNLWRWVDPRVRSVRYSDLRAYLLSREWTPEADPKGTLVRFERPAPAARPLYYMVPASDQADDFPQRVAELITTLSELEDRHPVEVLNDVLRAGRGKAGRGSQRGAEAEAV